MFTRGLLLRMALILSSAVSASTSAANDSSFQSSNQTSSWNVILSQSDPLTIVLGELPIDVDFLLSETQSSLVNFSLDIWLDKAHVAVIISKEFHICLNQNDSSENISSAYIDEEATRPTEFAVGQSNPSQVQHENLETETQRLDVSYERFNETNSSACNSGSVRVFPTGLGRARLLMKVHYVLEGDDNTTHEELLRGIEISVIRPFRIIDMIFQYFIFVLVGVSTFGFGCKISLPLVKQTFKRPKPIITGFISQYTIMPLIAYGVIMLQQYKGGEALGLFALGCAPGGGQSNMFTHLLGGDVEVSVTMTLLSTAAALVMLPVWMYTLGTTLPNEHGRQFDIPYLAIIQALSLILVPLAVGILIQFKLPRVAKNINKLLKWFNLLLVLFMFTVAVYANIYIFEMFTAQIVFTSALLPYGGFILGGVMALATRCSWSLAKTIAIETGIQNNGVAFMITQTVLDQPDLDLARLPIVAASIMSTLPLLVASLIYTVYKKKCVKNAEVAGPEEKAEAPIYENDEQHEKNSDAKELFDLGEEKPAVESKKDEKVPCYEDVVDESGQHLLPSTQT